MKRLLGLLLAALLLVAAACGDDETTAVADGPPAAPADGLVLRVERTGGFVMPDMAFAELPSVSIYADGRVLAPGAVIQIYPGPALVPLHQSSISEQRIADLLDLAGELELLGDPRDFGQPPVADAPDTVVTIVTAEGTSTQRANALAEGVDADGSALTDGQREARAQLLELVTAVEGSAFADDAGGEIYEPHGYAVRATTEQPEIDESSSEPQPRLVEWPVELLTLDAIGDCAVFEDGAADRLAALFAEADQLTFFTDADGTTWRVTVRPLLPDETGC